MQKQLLISLTLLFVVNGVLADCSLRTNVETEFYCSDIVFVGKVTSEEKVHPGSDGFYDGVNYQLSITESLRGNANKSVSVFSENSSGRYPMKVGTTYLVFANFDPNTYDGPAYTIYNCGHSGKVTYQPKTLSIVRQLHGSSSTKLKSIKCH